MRDSGPRRVRYTSRPGWRSGFVDAWPTSPWLFLVLIALVAGAVASPPAPVRMPGIYDGDDVVEVIAGTSRVVGVVECANAFDWVVAPETSPAVAYPLPTVHLRSPPV